MQNSETVSLRYGARIQTCRTHDARELNRALLVFTSAMVAGVSSKCWFYGIMKPRRSLWKITWCPNCFLKHLRTLGGAVNVTSTNLLLLMSDTPKRVMFIQVCFTAVIGDLPLLCSPFSPISRNLSRKYSPRWLLKEFLHNLTRIFWILCHKRRRFSQFSRKT